MRISSVIINKINAYFIIMLTIMLSLVGFYNYYSLKIQLNNELNEKITTIVNRLSNTLESPLLQSNKEEIKKILEHELADKELNKILVKNFHNGLIVGLKKDQYNNLSEINEINPATSNNNSIQTKDVIYMQNNKNQSLGKIILDVNHNYINKKLFASVIEQIIKILVLDFLLLMLQISIVSSFFQTPLDHINIILNDVVTIGDLRKRIPLQDNTNFTEISCTINKVVECLQNIMIKIKSTCNDLLTTSGDTTSASANIRDSIEQQKSEMTNLSSAINQLSESAQQVAQNAELSRQSIEKTKNDSLEGKTIVTQTENDIHVLSDNIQSAATVIDHLAEQANQIGAIVDVIQGIAEQTNLLALNAAIEAARAGEQGRGFAVVADEVRTLAQRTQKSTEEIHHMISQLQIGSKQAVQVIAKSLEQTKSSVTYVTNAGLTLEKISYAISELANMSVFISNAANEQSKVTSEINNNIHNITEFIKNTSAKTKDATNFFKKSLELTFDLENLIEQFKV